jgi:hypothetical protein
MRLGAVQFQWPLVLIHYFIGYVQLMGFQPMSIVTI